MKEQNKSIYGTPSLEIVTFELQDVLTLSRRDEGEEQGGEIDIDIGGGGGLIWS